MEDATASSKVGIAMPISPLRMASPTALADLAGDFSRKALTNMPHQWERERDMAMLFGPEVREERMTELRDEKGDLGEDCGGKLSFLSETNTNCPDYNSDKVLEESVELETTDIPINHFVI
jgi:hypothetical protein